MDISPFSILFAFMLGQLCTIFPLVCVYSFFTGPKDLPFRIPSSLEKGYLSSLRQSKKAVFWNALAGVNVGLGYFLYLVGSAVVSRAVAFIFGTSSQLLAVLMGVCVFKELQGKSLRQKGLCLLGVIFLMSAMGLMCAASLEVE
ncbi:unnamed protein product [Effrenium voratum]|nr:unnamed protein product [Effrenium voratum]